MIISALTVNPDTKQEALCGEGLGKDLSPAIPVNENNSIQQRLEAIEIIIVTDKFYSKYFHNEVVF